MANILGCKKINVGVLSLSRKSVVEPFLTILDNMEHENRLFKPIFIKIDAETLNNNNYTVKEDVEAVVLLHSIVEGRFSLTDVPDARYNTLLPTLCKLFGQNCVAVIAHAMPDYNEITKRVQMLVFKNGQTTTFKSSGCIFVWGKIDDAPQDDLITLKKFLAKAPEQRKGYLLECHTQRSKTDHPDHKPGDLDQISCKPGMLSQVPRQSEMRDKTPVKPETRDQIPRKPETRDKIPRKPETQVSQLNPGNPPKVKKNNQLTLAICSNTIKETCDRKDDLIQAIYKSFPLSSITILPCTSHEYEDVLKAVNAIALYQYHPDDSEIRYFVNEFPRGKRVNVGIFCRKENDKGEGTSRSGKRWNHDTDGFFVWKYKMEGQDPDISSNDVRFLKDWLESCRDMTFALKKKDESRCNIF